MNEVLARLRQDRAARPAASRAEPSSIFSALPAPPALIEVCVCAAFDLEWAIRFERQGSGLWRGVESFRLHDGESAGGRAGFTRSLDIAKIEGRYPPCPWCGDRSGRLYHCDCGAVVCGARVKGDVFTCRDSCGERWELGPPARAIQVSEARPSCNDWKPGERKVANGQAPPRDAAPARLLLGPGTRR
jgi:hypothetical protein